ncbi:MAG: ankyrin repeat domain-containing protein, partial [Janthinobacterium lividum]
MHSGNSSRLSASTPPTTVAAAASQAVPRSTDVFNLIERQDRGNIAALERALASTSGKRINIDAVSGGQTALQKAVGAGHNDLARLLLAHGAKVGMREQSSGNSSLHLAAAAGNADIIAELLRAGAAQKIMVLNLANHKGQTPLHLAAANGRLSVVQALLCHEELDLNLPCKRGISPLLCAVSLDHADIAALLMKHGADPALAATAGDSVLYQIACTNNLDLLELFCSCYRSYPGGLEQLANRPDWIGDTPLLAAIDEMADTAIVKQLLLMGADPLKRRRTGDSILCHALKGGNFSVIRLILESAIVKLERAGGDAQGHIENLLNQEFSDGMTPLLLGLKNGYSKTVNLLIGHGAAIDVRVSPRGQPELTPFHFCASRDTPACMALLINKAIETGRAHCLELINERNGDQFSPLALACQHGREATVRMLLECGARLDDDGPSHAMPLHQAIRGGHAGTVKLLLEHARMGGADMSTQLLCALDDEGSTPLMLAMQMGHRVLSQLLLRRMQSLDAGTQWLTSLFHHLAQHCGSEMLPVLIAHIEAGSNVPSLKQLLESCVQNEGRTALMGAALGENRQTFDALLELGCDVRPQDLRGCTVFHYVASHNTVDMARSLLEKIRALGGMQLVRQMLETRSQAGDTPLLLALRKKSPQLVTLLLEAGADLHASSSSGSSGSNAMHIAAQSDNTQCLKALLAFIGKSYGRSRKAEGKAVLERLLNAQTSAGHTPLMAAT